MYKCISSLVFAAAMVLFSAATVHAQDFNVPITVDGTTYNLTISLDEETPRVTAVDDGVEIGEISRIEKEAVSAEEQERTAQLAGAVTIPYDDLFRNNEDHVGEVVHYTGEVLEYQQAPCLFNCGDAGYIMRIAVTRGSYDIWDDPIYVTYAGDERFLEEDIVTLWGVVDGLETYTALLGNSVTIPRIDALEIRLGEHQNPASAEAAAVEAEPAQSATPAPPAAVGPTANRNANLRSGPGTEYAVVGSAQNDQPLTITGRNAATTWVQLENGNWIAAFLVDDLPDALPVIEAPAPAALPATPAATAASAVATATQEATATAAPAAQESPPSTVGIGDELQGNGWRFKVIETHKRKSVYFYDDGDAAMGHWLVVIVDAVNEQSGTDYFNRNIQPYLTDAAGNVYRVDDSASIYAKWQYGGLSSRFVDVDPGKLARVAMAFDLPAGVGEVMLSTDLPAWVKLGNFDQMEVEDQR